MEYYQEQKLKEMPANQGNLGGLNLTPMRMGLRDRVRERLAQSKEKASKAEKLQELDELLTNHPVLARVLELLEEIQ